MRRHSALASAALWLYATRSSARSARTACRIAPEPTLRLEETEMPKMKTKSSAKKRFKVTGTGKVVAAQAGKRHGMIKRTNKFIRTARGTQVLSEPDQKIVKSYMPYDR
jgi:large subunit ribosomal protein L35